MMKNLGLGTVIGCLSFAVLWVPNASAQEVSKQQLQNCASIGNPLQRLVCFDKLAAGEAPAVADGMNSQQPSTSSAEQEFGREHLADQSEQRPDKIYVEIADSQRNFYGKWELVLTNGQKWEQTDSRTVPLPDDGNYYIERGVLNSFFLGREGDVRRIRVRRIED